MKKLIIYLIIGIIMSLCNLTSCKGVDDIDVYPSHTGTVMNKTSDTIIVVWYMNNNKTDTLVIAPYNENSFIEYEYMSKYNFAFDSVSISNSVQRISFSIYENGKMISLPQSFRGTIDTERSSESAYYKTFIFTDTTFTYVADEMAKIGQDVWRMK